MEINSYHYYDPVHAYFLVFGFISGNLKSDVRINPSYEEFDKLNGRLLKNKDIKLSAVSAVNYWLIADDYYILRSGSTQRTDVGPIIISRKQYSKDEIENLRIAIPGRSFSGYFYYRLFFSAKEEIIMRYDTIMDAVIKGKVDLGLLIPGPSLTSAYGRYNLFKVADIMEEWKKETENLPMPLGSYVLSREYSKDDAKEIRKTFQESILYARENHLKAFDYAMKFAKGALPVDLEKFLEGCKSIYDMGERGVEAIRKVHELGKKRNFIEKIPNIDPV